jgi:hypothetical protein
VTINNNYRYCVTRAEEFVANTNLAEELDIIERLTLCRAVDDLGWVGLHLLMHLLSYTYLQDESENKMTNFKALIGSLNCCYLTNQQLCLKEL